MACASQDLCFWQILASGNWWECNDETFSVRGKSDMRQLESTIETLLTTQLAVATKILHPHWWEGDDENLLVKSDFLRRIQWLTRCLQRSEQLSQKMF